MTTVPHPVRRSDARPWGGLALGLATSLSVLLGAGALGIVGDGGRDDLPYLAAPVVAVLGAALGRLRPRATAAAFGVAGTVVVLAAVVVLLRGLPAGASLLDVVGISGMYAALYAAAAWLSRRAGD